MKEDEKKQRKELMLLSKKELVERVIYLNRHHLIDKKYIGLLREWLVEKFTGNSSLK